MSFRRPARPAHAARLAQPRRRRRRRRGDKRPPDDGRAPRAVRRTPPQGRRGGVRRRLASWSGRRHAWVAASLARLHGQHANRSDASRRPDQLLVRLLHQVRGSRARTLARTCLVADRLLRRRAAWAYFARHGLDPEAAAALASRDPEDDRDYIRFVTRAPAAVAAVSLERVLGVTDAFYWQSCAIATALSADPAAVRRVAGDHPAQTLVAIRNAGTPADLDLARHLLRAHGDDLDVLTSAIRCFAALRATDDLEPAVARGRVGTAIAYRRDSRTPSRERSDERFRLGARWTASAPSSA
jgi:hypothetical protein